MTQRQELLQQLCRDLRLLWTESGGPSLRELALKVDLGKSQVGAIINGKIRRPPDWDVVRNLIDSIRRHADDHGRRAELSLRTGIEEYWRPRYAVLEHAFRAGSHRRASETRPGTRVVPQQLPAGVAHFAGRSNELAALTRVFEQRADGPGAVVISAIGGSAGIGKTALAVRWAHRNRHRFPDGQLYVNLRGFDPSGAVMAPAVAVRLFLDALEVPPQRIPVELDAQVNLYRTLMAGRRMLVVLDNARDAEQVRLLLPGAPRCLVLITSRNQLTSLVAAEGAHHLTLDLLTPGEARDLLTRRLGTDRVTAEADATDKVIAACARLPLALSIVAARADTAEDLPLEALADELHTSRDRLDALSTGDDPRTDVRAVFSWSYQALAPDAARLFRLLGLHPGPDVSAPAAASLAGLPQPQVRTLLAELTRANLLVEHTPGRYAFHDLLRAYAASLAHTTDTDQQRRAATRRMLDHCLHTACAAAQLLRPAVEPISVGPPQPGTVPERILDHEQALAWFTVEHTVLMAAVDHAAASGFDTHTWQLASTLDGFLDLRGHWQDNLAVQHAAAAAAARLSDPVAQARAHGVTLARTYIQLGRYDDAHTHLRHALDLTTRAGDQVGKASTHIVLGVVRERHDDHAEALAHDRQALDLYRAGGHRRGEAHALNAVGWDYAQLGDYREALSYCQQALTLHQELGARSGQADAWDSIGYAHHHLGHQVRAITCYQQALTLFRDLGDRYNEANTLAHVGDAHHAAGHHDAAHDAWQLALAILDQLGHPKVDPLRRKLTARDNAPVAT